MKILLISGHGDGDSGACATIKGRTYKEADETITMVKLIKSTFSRYKADVDVYDTKKDAYKVLNRGGIINFAKYDLVLELHFNACVNDLRGNGKTTGVEVLQPSRNTPRDKKLESKICTAIAKFGLTNRGVKSQSLLVINKAQASGARACLIETCFIDDKDDMDIYVGNKTKIANAIASAVIDHYGITKKKYAEITKKCMYRNGMEVKKSTKMEWIKKGTEVEVLSEFTKWLKISYNGKTGYVVRKKIKLI